MGSNKALLPSAIRMTPSLPLSTSPTPTQIWEGKGSVLPSPLTATATVTSSWWTKQGRKFGKFPPSETRTQDFQPTVEPFPALPGTIERIAFVTTRAGNEDIWLISSFDIFPPMLSDRFGNPILPQITPKINMPGDTITLTAHVFDPESGVDKVYAIFKSADDPLFLWAVHNQGFPDQASGGNPGDQAAIAHEVDWFIVNFDPDTGAGTRSRQSGGVDV
jgi:hypothetical protein